MIRRSLERIGLRPELLGHRFVDDHDRRRGAGVALVERAAALDGILNTSKYPGETVIQPPPPWNGPSFERAADDRERQPVAALQRHAAGGARVDHAGDGLAAARRRCERPARPPSDFWNLRARQRHPHRQHVVRVEARDRRAPSAIAVRISSADPMSSTSASATSTTTRIERTLFCRKPVPERPLLSFSVVVRSVFELCSAGNQAEEDARSPARRRREADDAPVEPDERAVLADARQAGGVDRRAARGCRPCRAAARARRRPARARRSRSAAGG